MKIRFFYLFFTKIDFLLKNDKNYIAIGSTSFAFSAISCFVLLYTCAYVFGDIATPGYSFDAEFDDSRLFDGPGYIGISFSDGQTFGRIFITNDVHAYYEKQIRKDSQERDISDETIGKYVQDKITRFSKANTVFGRIMDKDLDKLDLLNKGTVINKIRLQ